MEKEIYLIRHGETDYNLHGMIQGSGIDSSLNAKGLQQAAMFFREYDEVGFDKIYVSGLKRTHESVQLFTNIGVPTEKHPELNEISWGDHEGRIASSLDKEYFDSVISAWKSGDTSVAVTNGESPDTLAAKHKKIIAKILSQKDEKRILICMHGRAMRIFLCTLLKISLIEMDRFQHENLCLYILRMNAGGNFEIILENDVAHLQQLVVVKA